MWGRGHIEIQCVQTGAVGFVYYNMGSRRGQITKALVQLN